MRAGPSRLLSRLEALQAEFGGAAAGRKLELLRALGRSRLGTARGVLRLHEALCFLRAYPDDAAVLSEVERLLAGFERRPDLARHARELENSGIAGTAISYACFTEMAGFLVRRFPQQVSVEWDDFEADQRLERCLPLLLTWAETPALDELTFPMRQWCRRLKGPDETDAAFLVKRFQALPVDSFLREWIYEEMDLPLRLSPARGTPSRTRARFPGVAVSFQDRSLDRSRPDLARALRARPRAVRSLAPREGARLIELAREAMLTRSRDLDAFAYGDARDVRLIEWDGGLAFAAIGLQPQRRLLLEAVYGFLTLKNGVPIGYVLNSALCGSAEIAYNVFPTFRGGEAARIYARVLATVRHLFGADSFTIYPYQLGDDNEEGLRSGAWWFYQKLGFRARDRRVLARMRSELARSKADPGRRTPLGTLRALARENVYYHLGPRRDDVIGLLPLSDIGLAVSGFLALHFGADREGGVRACLERARELCSLSSLAGWSRGERLALERWAPLIASLPGIERWTSAERRALGAVARAKGGRRESDYVRLFDAHVRLRAALPRLARLSRARPGSS